MTALTVREAALQLRCSARLIARLFDAGELRGFKVRGRRRVLAASLDDYVARHANDVPVHASPPRQPPPRFKWF